MDEIHYDDRQCKGNETGFSDNAADVFTRINTNASTEVSFIDSISFDVLNSNGEEGIDIDEVLSNEEDFLLFLSDDSIEAEDNRDNENIGCKDNKAGDNERNGDNSCNEKNQKEGNEEDTKETKYRSSLFSNCLKAIDNGSCREDKRDNVDNEKTSNEYETMEDSDNNEDDKVTNKEDNVIPDNENNKDNRNGSNENNKIEDKANNTKYTSSLSCREAEDNDTKENPDNGYKGNKDSDTKGDKINNNGDNISNKRYNDGDNEDAFVSHPIWSDFFRPKACAKKPMSILEQQLQKSKVGLEVLGNRTVQEEQSLMKNESHELVALGDMANVCESEFLSGKSKQTGTGEEIAGESENAEQEKNGKKGKTRIPEGMGTGKLGEEDSGTRQKEISVTDESKFRAGGKEGVELSVQKEARTEGWIESRELKGFETCTKTELETGKEGDIETSEIQQSNTKITDASNATQTKDSVNEFHLTISKDEQGKVVERQPKETGGMICGDDSELTSPTKKDLCLKIDNVYSMKAEPSMLKRVVFQDKSIESKFVDFEVANTELQHHGMSSGGILKHDIAGTYTPWSDNKVITSESTEIGSGSESLPHITTKPDNVKEIKMEQQPGDTANDLGIIVGEVYSINSRSPDEQERAIMGLLSHKGTREKLNAFGVEGLGNGTCGNTSSAISGGDVMADGDKMSSTTNLDIALKSTEGDEAERNAVSSRELSDFTEGSEHLSVVQPALGMVEIEIGCQGSESCLLFMDEEVQPNVYVNRTNAAPHIELMCKDKVKFSHSGAEASSTVTNCDKEDPLGSHNDKPKHETLKLNHLMRSPLSMSGVNGQMDLTNTSDILAKSEVPHGMQSDFKMPCILDVGTVQKDGEYKLYKGSVLESLVCADSKNMTRNEKKSVGSGNPEERLGTSHFAEERSRAFDDAVHSIALPIRTQQEVYVGSKDQEICKGPKNVEVYKRPDHEQLICHDNEGILEVGAMITLASDEERSEVLAFAEPRCKAFDTAVKAIGLPLYKPEGILQVTEKSKGGKRLTTKRKRQDEIDISTSDRDGGQENEAFSSRKAPPRDQRTTGAVDKSNQALESKSLKVSKAPVSDQQTARAAAQSNQAFEDKPLKANVAPCSDRQTTGAIVQRNQMTEDRSLKASSERHKHSSSRGSKSNAKQTKENVEQNAVASKGSSDTEKMTDAPLESYSTTVFQQPNNFITTGCGFPRMLLVVSPQNVTMQNPKQSVQLPPFHPFPGVPVMGPFPVNFTSQQVTQSNNGSGKPLPQGPASRFARLLPVPTIDPKLPTTLKVVGSGRITGGNILNPNRQTPAVVVTQGSGFDNRRTVANASRVTTGAQPSVPLSQSMNGVPHKNKWKKGGKNRAPAPETKSVSTSTRETETKSDRISLGHNQDSSKLLAHEPSLKRARNLSSDSNSISKTKQQNSNNNNSKHQQSGLLGRMCHSHIAKDLGALFKKHAAKLGLPSKKIVEASSGKATNSICSSEDWMESESRTGERDRETLSQETNTDSSKSCRRKHTSEIDVPNNEDLEASAQKKDSTIICSVSRKILEPESQIRQCYEKGIEVEASKSLEEIAREEVAMTLARVERQRIAGLNRAAKLKEKKAKMFERMRRLTDARAAATRAQTLKENREWMRANDYSASKALKDEVAKMIECSSDDNKPLLRSRFIKDKTQMNHPHASETKLCDNGKKKASSQEYAAATKGTKLCHSGTENTKILELGQPDNETKVPELCKEDAKTQDGELTADVAKLSYKAKEGTKTWELGPTTCETKSSDSGRALEYEQIRLSEVMEVCAAIVENPSAEEPVDGKIASTGNSISPQGTLKAFQDNPRSFNSTNAGNRSENNSMDSRPGLAVNPAEACFMVVDSNINSRIGSPIGVTQNCDANTKVGDNKIVSHLAPMKPVEEGRDWQSLRGHVSDASHVPRKTGGSRASPIEVECYEPKLPHDVNNVYFNVAIKSIAKNNLIFGCSPLLVSAPKLIDNNAGMYKKARRKRGRKPCNEKDQIQDKRQYQDNGLDKSDKQSLKNNQPITVKPAKPSSPVNCLIWKNVRYNGKLIGRKRTLLDACPVLFSWECSHLFTGRKFIHDKQSVMNRLQKYEVRMHRIIQRHKRKTAESKPESPSMKGGSPSTPQGKKGSPSSSLRATASQSPVNATQEKQVSPKAKEVNSILLEKARQLSQHFFDKHRMIYGNKLAAQTNNQSQNTMGSLVQEQSPLSGVSRPFIVRSSKRFHGLTTNANSEYKNQMEEISSDIRKQESNRKDGQVNSREEGVSESRQSNSKGAVNVADCTCSQVVKSIGCNVFEHSISKLARSVTRHVRKRKFSSATDHRCPQCDRVLSSAKELTRHSLYHLIDKAIDDNFAKGLRSENKPKKRRVEKEDIRCELRVVGFRGNMAENHDPRSGNSVCAENCNQAVVVNREDGSYFSDPESGKATFEIESKAVRASTKRTNSNNNDQDAGCKSDAELFDDQVKVLCGNNPVGLERMVDITNKAVEASTFSTNSRKNIAEIEPNVNKNVSNTCPKSIDGIGGDKLSRISKNEVNVQNSGTNEESTGVEAVNTDRINVSVEDSTLSVRNANLANGVLCTVDADAEISTVDESAEPKAGSLGPSEGVKDCLLGHGKVKIDGAIIGYDNGDESVKVERKSGPVAAIPDRSKENDENSLANRGKDIDVTANSDDVSTETAKAERNSSAVATFPDRNRDNDDGSMGHREMDVKGAVKKLNSGAECDANQQKSGNVVAFPDRSQDLQGTSSACQNMDVQPAYSEMNTSSEIEKTECESNSVFTILDQNTDRNTDDASLTSQRLDMDVITDDSNVPEPNRNFKHGNTSPERNKDKEGTPSACHNMDVGRAVDELNVDPEVTTAERNSYSVVALSDQNFDTDETSTVCLSTNTDEKVRKMTINAEDTIAERKSDAVRASSDRNFGKDETSTVCPSTNVRETVMHSSASPFRGKMYSNAEVTTAEQNSDAVLPSSDQDLDTDETSAICPGTNIDEALGDEEIAAIELTSGNARTHLSDTANIECSKGDIENTDCSKGDIATADSHKGEIANIGSPKAEGDILTEDSEDVSTNLRGISDSPYSERSRTADDVNRSSPNVVYKAQFWKMHQIPRISHDRDSPVECSSGEGKTVWTPVYFDVPVKPVKWQCLNCRRKFRGITELKTHAEDCRRAKGLSRDLDSHWKN